MKVFILILLAFLNFEVLAKSTSNLNKSGVILDGYDAVSYFNSAKPTKGQSQFQVKIEDQIFWFSNAANKEIFLKDSKKYSPQFGGWCAYAVADSQSKVNVDPESFVIQDGRLLLFYNGLWGNTREKWLNTKNKDAQTYLKEADANWPLTEKKEP